MSPHCSMRTLPLFSSVAQTPIGESGSKSPCSWSRSRPPFRCCGRYLGRGRSRRYRVGLRGRRAGVIGRERQGAGAAGMAVGHPRFCRVVVVVVGTPRLVTALEAGSSRSVCRVGVVIVEAAATLEVGGVPAGLATSSSLFERRSPLKSGRPRRLAKSSSSLERRSRWKSGRPRRPAE